MKIRLAIVIICTLLLSACDGDSRPFSEAAEVRTLNLESVEVVRTGDTLPNIFLNINQGLQLGVDGISGGGTRTRLSPNNRTWSVSDPAVARITKDGFLEALANGTVDVSLSIGGLNSPGFGLTVADATLSDINAISGVTTLEQCSPQRYFATGTFSDGTIRNLDNLTWAVNDPANARLIESTGSSTKLNALAALDQLSLIVTAPGGQSLEQPLLVSDSLQRIDIRPFTIILDVDEERRVAAFGTYTVSTGALADTTRERDITDDVDWAVVIGTDNLNVSNARGTRGLLTALEVGNPEITASCGSRIARNTVDINSVDDSTSLAFQIGNQLVTGNAITLSRAANPLPLTILASLGAEYDSDNDITSDVDFQRQDSNVIITPFDIEGNGTSTPTIRLTGNGVATIEATETTDGVAVEILTITVID